jgi:hypothetical protein
VLDAEKSAITPQDMSQLPQLDHDKCNARASGRNSARRPSSARSASAIPAAKRKHHATSSDNGDAPIEPPPRAAAAINTFVDSNGTARMTPIDDARVGAPIESSAGIGQIMATDLFTASGDVKWFRCKLAKHKKAWPSVRFDSDKLGAVS